MSKSQIDIIVSLLHPRPKNLSRNRIVMMECYLDESGIHDGSQVCVVGGFYGTHAAWKNFERQWNKVLDDYPEIKAVGFHAKRFFGRQNGQRLSPYTEWDDTKADKFLERLIRIINRNRVSPLMYAIKVKDFLDLPLDQRKWLTGARVTEKGKFITSGCPTKSYYLPFQFCVLDAIKIGKSIEKTHFFAGIDRTIGGYAGELYRYTLIDERLPLELRSLLGTLAFPLAKETPGIQAADLMINRLYNYLMAQIRAKKFMPFPKVLEQILKNKRIGQKAFLIDRKTMEMLNRIAQEEYQQFLRSKRTQQEGI